MKKSTQNDFDFEMINLDETAGWSQLEVESALNEQAAAKDNVFQGEITYEEYYEEDAEYYEEGEYDPEEYYEDEYYEEVPVIAPKKKSSKGGSSSKKGKAPKNGKSSSKGSSSSKSSKSGKNGKGKKTKKKETIWDKIAASFREMTVLDGVIAATGVLVLVVAIVTVSVFSSAKAAERQVAAFAPIGEDMSYLVDAGRGTLIAMADSDHWIKDMEETEEEIVDFEYEEKDLEETNTVNVNMKLTSVQKDLKIKFVNYKTGKLISNVKFEVSVTDANKNTKEYKDDDMDGIIYLKDVAPGKATVTMQDMTSFTDTLTASIVLKVGDNITTDHIMPAGAKILPYRSNIPHLSQYCFEVCDPAFAERAKAAGNGIIIGGSNYGQGSSREHAALVPMYLGIRCVIAKSFARIHVANLINAGILPVTFHNAEDYDKLTQNATLVLSDIAVGMRSGKISVTDETTGFTFTVDCSLTERQQKILLAGGLLNYTKEGGQ